MLGGSGGPRQFQEDSGVQGHKGQSQGAGPEGAGQEARQRVGQVEIGRGPAGPWGYPSLKGQRLLQVMT